jgi:hypothetical protein
MWNNVKSHINVQMSHVRLTLWTDERDKKIKECNYMCKSGFRFTSNTMLEGVKFRFTEVRNLAVYNEEEN